MPELRKDPIVDRWVIIASERAMRPSEYRVDRSLPTDGAVCPFCPGQEDKTPKDVLAYRDTPGGPWTLRVVPNRYPALKIEGELDREGVGLYDRMNGIGAHEVVIETPAHDKMFADLDVASVERVLRAYQDRIVDLKKDSRFRYVMVFKNHGAAAGATIAHSHSQIIALPIVPVAVTRELDGAKRYHEHKERCVYCDIVRQETSDGRRVILDNGDYLAIAPWAPRSPFETWILPRRHRAAYESEPKDRLRSLAAVLRATLGKLAIALDHPAYNFILHSAPLATGPEPAHYHWHIEIVPTVTHVAGFEWGSGCHINPTPPEDAAAFLRDIEVRP